MKKGALVSIFLMIVFLFLGTSSFASNIGVEDKCRSLLIGDFENGEILLENNIDEVMPIASVSKVMTYLVVMDEVKAGNISLDDMITINEEVEKVDGSSLDLKKDEKISVSDLLKGLMIVSGNDAAEALAIHAAGDVNQFVAKMNAKAKELGFEGAVFYNPSGLPVGQQQNSMRPRDIFQLARHTIQEYPEVLEYGKTTVLEMPERNFIGRSTLPLVGKMKGVDGLKTGYTHEAGYCFVGTMFIEPKSDTERDFRVISIVMGTDSERAREDIAQILMNYAMTHYSKRLVVDSSRPILEKNVQSAEKEKVSIYPTEDLIVLKDIKKPIHHKEVLSDDLLPPLKSGDIVGHMEVYEEDELIKTIELTVKDDVKSADLKTRISRFAHRYLRVMANLLEI